MRKIDVIKELVLKENSSIGISFVGDLENINDFSGFTFSDDYQPSFTMTDVENRLTELQADYDSKQYQRDRLLEYPSIEELVVALYDESDKASIIERRNAVKAKYPKPE